VVLEVEEVDLAEAVEALVDLAEAVVLSVVVVQAEDGKRREHSEVVTLNLFQGL
jgi:hypothetical protein